VARGASAQLGEHAAPTTVLKVTTTTAIITAITTVMTTAAGTTNPQSMYAFLQ
jgi:hypothetical protein